MLYDSERDGKKASIFRKKVKKDGHLYFIVMDSNDNVFGHYDGEFYNSFHMCYENGIFLFTLNSNGRYGVEMFEIFTVLEVDCRTEFEDGRDFFTCHYQCANSSIEPSAYSVGQIDKKKDSLIQEIREFNALEKTALTGQPDWFTTKRLIVIQMK